MPFRDDLTAQQQLIVDLQQRSRGLEQQLEGSLAAELTAAERKDLAALRKASRPRPVDDLDTAARLADALTRYCEALTRSSERLRAFVTGLHEVPTGFATPAGSVELVADTTLKVPEEVVAVSGIFLAIARSLDPGATSIQLGRSGFHAQVRVEGEPITLQCEGALEVRDYQPEEGGPRVRYLDVARWLLAATTTTPALAGPLRVKPQTIGEDVRLALGLLRDIEFDDLDFDGQFRLQGSELLARRVLTKSVRHALCQIARTEPPCFEVEGGRASIRWHALPDPVSFAGAVAALVGLRRALRSPG